MFWDEQALCHSLGRSILLAKACWSLKPLGLTWRIWKNRRHCGHSSFKGVLIGRPGTIVRRGYGIVSAAFRREAVTLFPVCSQIVLGGEMVWSPYLFNMFNNESAHTKKTSV